MEHTGPTRSNIKFKLSLLSPHVTKSFSVEMRSSVRLAHCASSPSASECARRVAVATTEGTNCGAVRTRAVTLVQLKAKQTVSGLELEVPRG